jgi:hypothetical protein
MRFLWVALSGRIKLNQCRLFDGGVNERGSADPRESDMVKK